MLNYFLHADPEITKKDKVLLSVAKISKVLSSPLEATYYNGYYWNCWVMVINRTDAEVLKAMNIHYCAANGLIFPSKGDYEEYSQWV